MDASLFSVYTNLLSKKKETTEAIQTLFKEVFDIEIQTGAITVKGKEVTLNVSSVLRMRMKQKDFKTKLKEKGFLMK